MDGNKILGIVLIALGALLLLGWLEIPFATEIIAIALVVIGILMLMGSLSAPRWLAITLIVVGAVVLLKDLDLLGNVGTTVAGIINTLAAVAIIILGVLKLKG